MRIFFPFFFQIAIYGRNFCAATKDAFMLIMRNVLRSVDQLCHVLMCRNFNPYHVLMCPSYNPYHVLMCPSYNPYHV